MYLAVLLIAAGAATAHPARANDAWREQVLLAVNEEAAAPQAKADTVPEAEDSKIEHTPLEKTPRGLTVIIKAKIADPSHLFAPLVFARKQGTTRYEAFTMRDKGKRGFRAYLPSSILSEGAFEYFIEAQHEEGGATRLGSPRKPFTTVAFDPPPQPVSYSLRTEEPGASVRIDDNDVGKTPITFTLLPGPHTVAVTAADGRSAQRQIDVTPARKKQDLFVDFRSQAGGPAMLSVQSDPPNANVLVDAAMVGRTPYSGEIQPGDHTVAVEAEGRMREERRLVAHEGQDANVSFALAPLPKTPAIAVESEPIGAQVILDSKERGRTPFLAPLEKGHHEVVLKLEGHREVGTDFNMPSDRDLSIRLDLPVGQGTGSRLTLTSTPQGAKVAIDGKDVGISPWSGDIRPGNHKVAVAADGFVREERVVQVQPSRDSDVTFALNRAPGPGKLHVESEPPEAVVAVDGQQSGSTPNTVDVPPGDHTLEVTLEGYKTIQQQFTIDPGQALSLKLALQQAVEGQVPPLIAVASDPAGAQLFVDGKSIGPTPIKARSTPGAHEIKLSLDGYITRTGKIHLPDSRDFELRMAISLKPVRGVEEVHEAPSNKDLAKAQVASAHACSKTGDYDCAIKGYQKAYEYEPNPLLLFNIAQMRRKMGQFPEAARAYQSFLRDAPTGQEKVKDEAQKQLAFCELKMKPAAGGATTTGQPGQPTAVAQQQAEDEDTDPPVLTHDVITKAVRSQPLALTARIVDERSGVATPQACWKNLYKKDFTCLPMGKTGEDTYGIQVPAKDVNDGFSYYLEAYDNNDNGPARSGAPELPNAVAVEEPPPTQATTVAVNAVSLQEEQLQQKNKQLEEALAQRPLPTPAPKPQESSHVLRWVMMGGAAAAAGTSLGLHFHANSLVNSINDPNYTGNKSDLQSQANTEQSASNILIGVTLAFAIGAVAFWNF
ncbi:MAG TPA: PEGA domain-containing protein [Myxococcales bacterium]|nr:PEGA domain-containing protein [Myxococcales bacterium]